MAAQLSAAAGEQSVILPTSLSSPPQNEAASEAINEDEERNKEETRP